MRMLPKLHFFGIKQQCLLVIVDTYKEMIMKSFVVIIEEDKKTMEVAAKVAEEQGYAVVRFLDSTKALRFLKRNAGISPIQAVISDTKMSEKSGLEILSELQEYNESLDLPFIFVSNEGINKDQLDLSNYNRQIILEKPVNPERIHDALKLV